MWNYKKGMIAGLLCMLAISGCARAEETWKETQQETQQATQQESAAKQTEGVEKTEASDGQEKGAAQTEGTTMPQDTEQAEPVRFTDDLGYEIVMQRPEKTAVLSGSLAQAWVLAGGGLAATTEDAVRDGEALYSEDTVNLGLLKSPDVERMIAEEIDFVVLSATIAEHVKLRDTLEAAGITTAYFEVETFEEYGKMMRVMTEITGREDCYHTNVEQPSELIQEQIARADGSEPTVLFLRAYSTGVRAKGSDSMTGQMLKDLGAVNIADREDSLLQDLSLEVIAAEDPDYIFVTTMGESQEDALAMVDELLLSNPVWKGLTAVQQDRYYVLPKELFHNKPNNRWGESYQILADILYGE